MKQSNNILEIDCKSFHFGTSLQNSAVLTENVDRYENLICKNLGVSIYPWKHQETILENHGKNMTSDSNTRKQNVKVKKRIRRKVKQLEIIVMKISREYPHLWMDESCMYKLDFGND